jgi:CRT-like, chloroquine-resistance transporter-like
MSTSQKTTKQSEHDHLLQPKNAIEKNVTNSLTDSKVDDDPDEKEDTGSTLIIAFFLMLVFQLGNRIFGRLATYPMHNYPIFMNIVSCAVYIPICFAYILPMIAYTNAISKEQQEIPKYKFAIMGAYDSLAGIMQTFAINYITNSGTIVLVQQSAIPISMLISKIALQAQYTFSQYLGATVVLFGIAVVLIPNFITPSSGTDASGSEGGDFELLWIFVLVLSCVPMCLSSVYKEKALGEMEIDVVYLNGWVAIYQFLFALPLCIPSSAVINMAVSEIIPNMYGGAFCWMGINTITHGNLSGLPADDCADAPLFVTSYLCFNIVFNILIVVILKHGSANIMWMASTVIVPLSNVAFSLNIMPGHKPLNTFDVVGLFVIMFGLVLYRFMGQIISSIQKLSGKQRKEDADEERKVRKIGIRAERKQTKYVGFNQMESLQSLIDTRVWRAQRQGLFRTPQQIRGTLLLRLGIPPSPHVSMPMGISNASRRNQLPSTYMKSPIPIRSPAIVSNGRNIHSPKNQSPSIGKDAPKKVAAEV